ncbi:HmuY family protein [Arcicella aquatica]|uniref:HmuY family protein n=1 Tax=Arcicella aquatica TaxID=217141 RepID=A0ABU5QM89_9BACT|nr:HmuY family protein [Arcicella aquatica]MEA5258138.1 HmuY family protein [Arcicella aquatica]
MNSLQKIALSALVISTLFIACKKDDEVVVQPVKSETVKDLAADPTTNVSATGQPTGTGKYTFFSFKNGIVASSDSATTKWDIGVRATTIITNGGGSGSGQGGAVVITGIFDEIKEVPASATFAQDTKTTFAIPTGAGNGWYNYANGIITPAAGKVILIKTADGKYAKVEILSYYKGAPTTPTTTDVARYYTFRYVYQPEASTKFN